MKLILGLFLVAAIGTAAILEGEEIYKAWLRHQNALANRPDRNYHHGPGANIISEEILAMSEGETSWHHGRYVTRQGDTWAVDGQTYENAWSAANYL